MASLGGNIRRFLTEVSSLRAARKHLDAYVAPDGQTFDVVLPFSEHAANLYQIRQWLKPLEALAEHHRVAIACRDLDVYQVLRTETTVPVLLMAPDPRELWSSSVGTKVFLYPNQDHRNLKMFGDDVAQHVFISHGESDKIYMYSNLVKSFTRYFVAGEVARRRLARHLLNYDVDDRTLMIGRPQIDYLPQERVLPADDRTTVLYAPTWEGLRPAMRYGSGPTHGVTLVSGLLADRRFRVVYRPHPLTGTQVSAYAAADREIVALLAAANRDDPSAAHVVDRGGWGWQLSDADVMISDISAVAYDWLPMAKPLLLTRPAEPEVAVEASLLIDSVCSVGADEAGDIVDIIDDVVKNPRSQEALRQLAEAYYGDTSPGASTARFVGAVTHLIAERDAWVRDHPEALTTRRRTMSPHPVRDLLGFSAGKLVDSTLGKPWAARDLERAADHGSADFMVMFPPGATRIRRLLRWRSTLTRLSRRAGVVIVVHDTIVYALLRLLRLRDVYLWQGSGAPDHLVASFGTKVMIYVEQSERNLRETAVHDVLHVFLGRGEDPEVWGSNRLRVFDNVLTSDPNLPTWMREHVLHFDEAGKFRVVAESAYPDELLRLVAERDRLVVARDAAVSARGVEA